MNANRYEQAVDGLDVSMSAGAVVVADGADTWVVDRASWDGADADLSGLPVLEDDDGGMLAYTQLCSLCAHYASLPAMSSDPALTQGALVTMQGTSRGTSAARQSLLSIAVGQGVLGEDVAERLGWERPVDPSCAVVRDYATGEILADATTPHVRATPALILASRKAGPEGAVSAWQRIAGQTPGVITYRWDVAGPGASQVRTVYVEE